MIIKELKLVNFDKYFSELVSSNPRDDLTIHTKLNMILNQACISCTIEGLTILEFAFLKEMASSAVLLNISVTNITDTSNSFNKRAADLIELSRAITEDADCVDTDFGILPLFANNFKGYFRFSGSTITNITSSKIARYLREGKQNNIKEFEALVTNDILSTFSDTIRSYYQNLDPMSESIAHYKFYSTTSDVTLLNMKTSTGILNFLNATEGDKVTGMDSIKTLIDSPISSKAILDDVSLSFVVHSTIATFGLFSIFTKGVNLYDVDSFRLIMNGRDMIYPKELLTKYMHRIEDSIVNYLNERDKFIQSKKFTIEDIMATIPTNTACRFIVTLPLLDALYITDLLDEFGISDNSKLTMAHRQFYEVCKDIATKSKLVSDKFFVDN